MPRFSIPMRHALAAAAILVMSGCGGDGTGAGSVHLPALGNGSFPDSNPGLPPQVSMAPQDTGDGWIPSTPGAEGIDEETLQGVFDRLLDGRYPGVDSLLVVRHGRLVAEGYFNGFGRDTLHDLRSTGKSVTSALAGIAIDQGLIGLDEPISSYLPRFEDYANMGTRKRDITIHHLLDMNSGLACDDWNASSPGNEERMYPHRDWVKFILDLPMTFPPGRVPSYCTGGVVVLGHIIARTSGMALDAYAQAYLFDPLGIGDSAWRRSLDGQATGGGGLRLRPRDAAKFGALYLAGGAWNGEQVVPEAWALQSRERVHMLGEDGYGLLWWKRTFDHDSGPVESFFTSGNGGNFIFVLPALELVVVFTGSNYNSDLMTRPFNILAAYLVPAVN